MRRDFAVKGGPPVEAVRGVDLDVGRGELVAFLGPNGAGKSTTLRMLTTLLPPSAGSAEVAGHDVTADPAGVRRRIGYIGQGNSAGHHQRVRDELVTQGRCHGLSTVEARRRTDELVADFDLSSFADRGVGTLSGGQRRRLDVAMGLVHRPELLFLDEPSSGLDPHHRANLWEHIVRQRERDGTTIFMTTHYLDEADTMAERVIVIDHGRVIADDTAPVLKARLAGDRITLTFADPLDAKRAASLSASPPGPAVDGSTVEYRVPDGPARLPALLRELCDAGIDVVTAAVSRPTLDDVFLALTGRSLREESR
ncbi:ABC transporter [Virgisporangium aliadipatigenens]|uniref:ABC transporter n=1 Tax=Virgisporangium aliadipatigenens TaxID=741659 RepID=A0A8J3YNJ2_9ACTN|nr:ABC transporter [Virgisporangium aliadipatigenens]